MSEQERTPDAPVHIDEFRAEMREAGVEEVVDDAIAAFMDEMPSRVYAILAAVAEGDIASVSKLGHAMKSAAGAIRAKRLAQLAAAMEQAGKNDQLDEARSLAPEMQSECDAVFEFLRGEATS